MDIESSKHNRLDSILQYRSLGPHKLPLEDLRKITNNFSDERLLGEGGFGKVYMGVLQSGDMVAVKRLMSTMPGIQDTQFENEVHHLMRLKHQNIVQLLGYSSEIESILTEYNGRYVYAEKSEKLLCLEYLPNGSLHGHLSDESSGLDWVTRYKILEGVCNGLHYLQETGQVSPIIHMDLKPTNILLDDNMVPKIADFGLSRLFGAEKTRTRTLNCHGTLGYMPPEYVERGIITKKLDIFSLGVIIIEIMTGRKDYPEDPGTSSHEFIELVLKNWRNRLEKAPSYTSGQTDCLQIRRCIQIGLLCVERDRTKRPTIQQIIRMLHIPVLERDYVMKFEEVITPLEQALLDFAFNKPNISDEARKQVEFMHVQLKSAKEWAYMPDDGFYNDMPSLDNNNYDPRTDPTMRKMLSQKLYLKTITYLTRASLALHEMVVSGDGQDPGGHIEKMSMLLKKIKDFVQTQNPERGPPIASKSLQLDSTGEPGPVTIPDDFRCPISLELMKDPVIVVTGQTYERVCIEKWLASGHHTCPTTQQRMESTTFIPNYVLRNLIAQWCEANGIEPPKRSSQPNKPTSACSSSQRANIDALLSKLCSPDPEVQKSAAAELRLLAKRNANNRICIAEAGAIPLLLSLLSSSDLRTQEHAVTALLNLSIHEDNKASIVSSGAVPSIVHVLQNGSMEARENAAATLFSLSVIRDYKVKIGETGAIPALVVLLNEGSQRGKKDAAAALSNLCIYQGNKSCAIRAGLVPLIMKLVTNPTATGHLMDEAMAILSILSSHPEGKAAIGAAEPVPVLVEMIGSGTPRNRENAAAVMLQLCCGENQLVHLDRAQECEIVIPLRELALNGTERAKQKAVRLLERIVEH